MLTLTLTLLRACCWTLAILLTRGDRLLARLYRGVYALRLRQAANEASSEKE